MQVFSLEPLVPFWGKKVAAGEFAAYQAAELVLKCAQQLVNLRVRFRLGLRITAVFSAVPQAQCHDRPDQRPTGLPMTSDAAAESGGDSWDARALNPQSLNEALQHRLRSVESLVEIPRRPLLYLIHRYFLPGMSNTETLSRREYSFGLGNLSGFLAEKTWYKGLAFDCLERTEVGKPKGLFSVPSRQMNIESLYFATSTQSVKPTPPVPNKALLFSLPILRASVFRFYPYATLTFFATAMHLFAKSDIEWTSCPIK